MLAGMGGMNGVSLPKYFATPLNIFNSIPNHIVVFEGVFSNTHLARENAMIFIPLGLGIVWFLPNVREMFAHYKATWEDASGKIPPSAR